jgi:DMSO reductase anchor subunit
MRTTTSFINFKLSILKNESGTCTLYGLMADGSFQLTTMSEQIDNSKWLCIVLISIIIVSFIFDNLG